jgi:hypothetical protein
VGGVEAVRELARERRGEQFDPAVSDLPRGGVPGRRARLSAAHACCITSMFLWMAASVSASSSVGLKSTN